MAARRRGHHEEGHANHERWLITYSDLITLLMVFFVVMYSMSRADTTKFARLAASLQRAFNVEVLKGNVPTSLHGQDGTLQATSALQEALASAGTTPLDTGLISTADELRAVLTRLPPPPRGGNVQVGTTRDGVVISLSGNVLFDSGKAELRPEGQVLLDVLAQHLRLIPNDLRIEGHTDNIPIHSTLYPSNWELSSARATTVARYLAQHGIAPQRLIAAGYGEYRPAAPNDTREGRARNRRVDIVILSSAQATFPNRPDTDLVPPVVGSPRSGSGGSTP
ncbi:MAG TPA: flagellar motor protein MotB [Chloroflexota bacterium]|jgi:chemotaxis protein MotB|nr:flagellar motor protein MotB [Chloroflexota bacterium]